MNASSGSKPLDIGRIAAGALSLPSQYRERLWSGIGTPIALIIGSAIVVAYTPLFFDPRSRLALHALHFGCLAAIAVVIHRLVLLAGIESSTTLKGRPRRIALALCALVGLWLVFVAVGRAVDYLVRFGFSSVGLYVPPFWRLLVASTTAVWVVARLCLVTPGLVLDKPRAVVTAWKASRGNGWRLAAVIAIAPWLLTLFVQSLWPRGVGRLEFVLVIVMGALLSIFEFFAVSLCYRELTARMPPPTTPPA
jgi:hypothetical protein